MEKLSLNNKTKKTKMKNLKYLFLSLFFISCQLQVDEQDSVNRGTITSERFTENICAAISPTNQSDNLKTYPPNPGDNWIEFHYKKGNGDYNMVIGNPYHPVDILPVDGPFTYTWDLIYGNGTDLGNDNFVMNVTGDEGTDLADFLQNTTSSGKFYIRIIEFNYDSENDCTVFLRTTTSTNPTVINY
jgi:hypothetical protein